MSVETTTAIRTDEVAEERDLVGVYLHEISRTPLLDAAEEVELSKAVEAGLYAGHLLSAGKLPKRVTREQAHQII
ncbi:MAG: sigma-70 factor domain-containing protein, partial [Stackebrandtia sp.]